MGNGESEDSDCFNVEIEGVETAWKLRCYPRGRDYVEEDPEIQISQNIYVGLFLVPANTAAINRKIQITIELGTKNDGLTVISAEKYFCFKDKTELGWPEFATHRFLRW